MKNLFIELTVGASSSGKSTYAEKRVRDSKGKIVNVNRDDIRRSLFQIKSWKQYSFSKAREQLVTQVQHGAIRDALAQGKSVIVSDTNLNLKFREVFTQFGVEVRTIWFPVELEELKRRNRTRGAWSVRNDVVERMYEQFTSQHNYECIDYTPDLELIKQYEGDTSLPNAVIVDVDGTIADKNDRNPFEWLAVGSDTPRWHVINMVQLLHKSGVKIVIASGRDNVCRQLTIDWMKKFDVPFDLLVMRGQHLNMDAPDYQPDQRNDAVIKKELFWNDIAPKYNVLHTIDDRDRVVEMWRSMGIECFQVAAGDF